MALHSFAQGILNGVEIPLEASEALLVLIPKVERLTFMKDFRSISLCNTSLKVVTKMLVNMMKGMLKEIIGPTQASFIPGRQSVDNIVICQDILHTLKYTKARVGGMVLKLDLEKAYDRVEWSIVEEMLRDIPIPDKFISMIMNLLHSSSCRLL